jgi:arginine decarboxylase
MAPLADPLFSEEQSFYSEAPKKPWSVQKSCQLYRVQGWGAPYFKINAYGNIAVCPQGGRTDPNDEIDLMKTINKVVTGRDNISMPLIIRFPDILKNRMETLQSAFDAGIKRQSYSGTFQGVFPVKCNPDRYLVEEIVSHGRHMNFGLEAGSKPELLLVMAAMCKASAEAFVICNGYKDGEYVEMALVGRRMGLKTVIVLEQVEELETVLMLSKRLQIQPVIGVRAKLSTKHAGHWGDTSGEKGKFGLSACEIVQVVRRLRKVNMLDCLQLLHFHIGSQIPSLALVRDGVSEAAHIFCELALMGANMNVIDIGGGLGVDYDGTHSSQSEMSIGYNIEEYADTVVEAIKDATSQKHVNQPVLSCESGRALVSHHAVLVFDVLSAHKSGSGIIGHDRGIPMKIEGLPEELVHLQDELVRCIGIGNYEGALTCARQLKFQCSHLFKAGLLRLEVRAAIDEMLEIVSTCADRKENQTMASSFVENSCGERPGSRESSKGEYFSTYHINLSIFKSMPDSWAIGQLFPIVPLHRLETEPKERVILSDLTCDSDGKVTTFIGNGKCGEAAKHLCAHELEEGKPYYMGMFLGGAYQEVLGSTHNLFGNPNVVHVVPSRGGDGFIISKFLPGQSLSCTLRAMHHDPKVMFDDLKHRVDTCVLDGMLGKGEALSAMSTLATSFHSYTYLYSEVRKSSAVFCR